MDNGIKHENIEIGKTLPHDLINLDVPEIMNNSLKLLWAL